MCVCGKQVSYNDSPGDWKGCLGRNRLCFLFTLENFLLVSPWERPLCSVGSLFEGVKCQGGEGIESNPRERNIPNLCSMTRVLEDI